jgi:putative transcriptional regulator
LRAERNWSQAKLVEEQDVSRQTINSIEIGKNAPSMPLAFMTAKLIASTIKDNIAPSDVNKFQAISRYHCEKATCTCGRADAVRHGQAHCYKKRSIPHTA